MLAGYGAADLLVECLLLLEAGAMVLALVFSVLLAVGSSPPDLGALVLGNSLTAVIGVPLGLAVGALLPRELEGTLLLRWAGGDRAATDARSRRPVPK